MNILDRSPDQSGLEVGPIYVLERPIHLRGLAPDVRSPGRDPISQNRYLYVGGRQCIALDGRGVNIQIGKVGCPDRTPCRRVCFRRPRRHQPGQIVWQSNSTLYLATSGRGDHHFLTGSPETLPAIVGRKSSYRLRTISKANADRGIGDRGGLFDGDTLRWCKR